MAFDLEAIKRRMAQLSGKNFGSQWKPKPPSEHYVRIIALPNNDGEPCATRMFYYDISKFPIIAPYQFGRPDPFQELINKLREDGSPESRELAKKLYPKPKHYAAVIVRGEEDKGPQIWGFSKSVYSSILTLMMDPDYGDITDVERGHDIKVTISQAPGKQYWDTAIMARPKPTALSSKPEDVIKWTSSIPNVDALNPPKTYEELEKVLNDWLNPPGESAEGGGEEKMTTRPPITPPAAGAHKKPSGKSLDDVFAQIENED
jgi:hypothetical protein